jgi:hypothetical protein
VRDGNGTQTRSTGASGLSNRQSSIFVAAVDVIAKLTPSLSGVAPRGKGWPGSTSTTNMIAYNQ